MQDERSPARRAPAAAKGCIVFVERGGVCVLAKVKDHKGACALRLGARQRSEEDGSALAAQEDAAPFGPAPLPTDDIALGAASDPMAWHDAALPQCCVCLDGRADAALDCRCSAPSVCRECAAKIVKCPHCRAAVDPCLWRFCFSSNIFSSDAALGRRSFQLFFKTPSNQTIIVEAFGDWTVADLKMAVMTKTGLAYNTQRMFLRGRYLCEHESLAWYSIERESTILLIINAWGD